jgi:hypothetical protein
MNSMQSVVITLSIGYALIGALLLVVLVFARLPWPAKVVFVVVTSAFYVAGFYGTRGLLGFASIEKLPATFKLLQVRVVDPHTVEGDPGSIYLWVEALDEDNRPSGIPRSYRLPYTDALAEKVDKAASEVAAGRSQAGRAADFGTGEGGLLEIARQLITPEAILETSGGDPSTGAGLPAAPRAGDGVSFTPLLPPRMPPKDIPELPPGFERSLRGRQ